MTSTQNLNFFATAPKGLELLLAEELRQLGALQVAEKLAGVTFSGDLRLAYRACLWSRLANRILLPLTTTPAATPEELYAGVQTIAWDEHLQPTDTLAVHFVSSRSNITHSLYGAQKVKDAIVDQFREKYAIRPNVTRQQPQVMVYVYLHHNQAMIGLDLSGESLHKRAYRLAGGVAPLKENLAAAILLRAGWPELAKEGRPLLDPMCGSGSLLIEAALLAGDIAPGLQRSYFGFLGWKKHDAPSWQALLIEAENRSQLGKASLPPIIGYDQDSNAIKAAFENIHRAGLTGKIHVEKRELAIFVPPAKHASGLVVVNPPYGERLGDVAALKSLYACLGERLKQAFVGWQAAIFTGNPALGKEMGIRAKRFYALWNGPIACQLLLFTIEPAIFVDQSPAANNVRRIRAAQRELGGQRSPGIEMFLNRLHKNLKHFRRQAHKQGVKRYRIYDADLPEYSFSIEIDEQNVYLQEYPVPQTANQHKVQRRRQEVLAVLPDALKIEPAHIFLTEAHFRHDTED